MNSNSIWLLNRKTWDFLNPDPASLDWPTVALVLARIGRWGGHTTQGVYSVAQHLVEGARAILRDGHTREVAAAYLLHDVHEFVIGDDVRPKVEALAALAGEAARNDGGWEYQAERWLKSAFRELKARADAVIYPAAGLPWPLLEETQEVVKEYDNRMLRTEADARTGPRVAPWGSVVEDAEPIQGADCSVWSAELAASLWLSLAKEILPALQPTVAKPVEDCECCDAPLAPTLGETTGYGMQDLRGWPDSPAQSSPHTVLSGEKQDEQRYGNKRFKPKQPPVPPDQGLGEQVREVADTFSAFTVIKEQFFPNTTAPSRVEVKDWCDWADGGRPGTCTACGGVFGMLYAPSVCLRGLC